MKSVRKLAIFSIGYAASVFAAHYILPYETLLTAVVLAAAAALPGLLFKGNARKRILLAALAAAIGFLGYKYHYDSTVIPCEELTGKTLTVQVQVLDYPMHYDYCSRINVKLKTDGVPQVKTAIYDYDHKLTDVEPGDMLSVKLRFRSAATRYGEEVDNCISDGIYAIGNLEEAELISHGGSVKFLPQRIGKALRTQIKSVFPQDAAPFMLALLTGDRSEYYNDDALYSAMGVSGLAHAVAISGMHVSFLVAFLQLVMGRSRRTSLLCLTLIWAFVVMSGSSPSAVRAGIMLSVFLLAPVFGRENDRTTSLCFALALILAANPFAAGSVSLQLSFSAMAGIYLFAQPVYDWLNTHIKGKGRLRSYLIGSLSSSLSVTVFSVPLIAVHFGYVSLLMPITNILCLWAVSVLFVGGYAVCLIGFVIKPLAALAAGVLAYLVRYIAFVVKGLARLPYSAVYTENLYAVLWLAFVYAAFTVWYFVRRKVKRLNPLIPAALSLIALLGVFLQTRADMLNDTGTLSVMDVGSGQCIAVTEGEHAAVIDCGSRGTMTNAGSEVGQYLLASGRWKIDCLILTHLHSDHINGVVRLMNTVKVGTLVLPEYVGYIDDGVLSELVAAAHDNHVGLMYISRDTELNAGGISLKLYAPFDKGDKNDRGIMLTAEIGNESVLVTGDVREATERKLVNAQDLSDTDILIVGHHGSKYSTSEELLDEADPEKAVISVGYNNYGHPADEVLERLREHGITIYRTDERGRIVINCGD